MSLVTRQVERSPQTQKFLRNVQSDARLAPAQSSGARVSTTKKQRVANPMPNKPPVRAVAEHQTESQSSAKAIVASALSVATLSTFIDLKKQPIDPADLFAEMKRVSTEVVEGDLSSMERVLTHQFLSLDAMFNTLAMRAHRQDNLKNLDALLRLALKAQSQARATAETLAEMKNPTPYIRQANIAHGHQQVNNLPTREHSMQKPPNELLEPSDAKHMDG